MDNFNLSPDIVDSGAALEVAEKLESKWDPEPTRVAAQKAKEKAEKLKYEQILYSVGCRKVQKIIVLIFVNENPGGTAV